MTPTNTKQLRDFREYFRELGFGNQAVIVGTKRRELFTEIESLLQAHEQEVRVGERRIRNKLVDMYIEKYGRSIPNELADLALQALSEGNNKEEV